MYYEGSETIARRIAQPLISKDFTAQGRNCADPWDRPRYSAEVKSATGDPAHLTLCRAARCWSSTEGGVALIRRPAWRSWLVAARSIPVTAW